MLIKKGLPQESYTKIANEVIKDQTLGPTAFRLYALIASMPNGRNITDAYLEKCMGVSNSSLKRLKRELRDKDLILIDRLAPKVYVLYVGHYKNPASSVKGWWDADKEE